MLLWLISFSRQKQNGMEYSPNGPTYMLFGIKLLYNAKCFYWWRIEKCKISVQLDCLTLTPASSREHKWATGNLEFSIENRWKSGSSRVGCGYFVRKQFSLETSIKHAIINLKSQVPLFVFGFLSRCMTICYIKLWNLSYCRMMIIQHIIQLSVTLLISFYVHKVLSRNLKIIK